MEKTFCFMTKSNGLDHVVGDDVAQHGKEIVVGAVGAAILAYAT